VECSEMPDTSVRSDDCLLNADIEELEACLKKKKLRYACQQERLERLQQTLNNTREDIRVLATILHYVQMHHPMGCYHRFAAYKDIVHFFIRASEVYDELCHRLHCHINYRYFCMVIHLCYHLDKLCPAKGARQLVGLHHTGLF